MRLVPLLLAFSVAFAACDSGDAREPGLPALGAFQATVAFDDGETFGITGVASATMATVFTYEPIFIPSDTVYFPAGPVPAPGQRLIGSDTLRTLFMLSLTELDPGRPPVAGQPLRFISLTRAGVDQPQPGTYPLGAFERDEFSAFFAISEAGSTPGGTVYAAESGTLSVEVSTADRITGTFSFRAASVPDEAGTPVRTATITGTFDAAVRGVLFP